MRVSECILEAFISVSYSGTQDDIEWNDRHHGTVDRQEKLRLSVESIHPDWFGYLIARERPCLRPLFDSWMAQRVTIHEETDRHLLFHWIDQAVSVCFPALPFPDPDAFNIDNLHRQPVSRLNSILYRIGVIECASVLRAHHQHSVNRLISCFAEPLRSDFVLAFSRRTHRESLSRDGSRTQLLRILPSSQNPMMLLLRLGIAVTAGCFSSVTERSVPVLCCKVPVEHACDLVRRLTVTHPSGIAAARKELDTVLSHVRSIWYA